MAERPESGWLVEQGIGEERALLYRNQKPIAARLRWPGGLEAGMVLEGTLVSKPRGQNRGRAQFPGGENALVDRLPPDASEGAQMRFHVTRAALGEAMRVKLAQVRPTDEPLHDAPTLAETLPDARVVRTFPHDDWEEIRDLAVDGTVGFTGGSLFFSPTPAMTVVDIDGRLPPYELALAAVEPLARALQLFDLRGIVTIDFPTLESKTQRQEIDRALAQALDDFPHERTGMNGFGLVQIVSRLERPSLLHRVQIDRAGAAARLALRRAGEVQGAGKIEIFAHPAVLAKLRDDWLDELRRRTGKELSMRPDPGLALEAPHAQLVPL